MIKTMDDLIKDGEDFLQHHGVKGQKWGVQNGPPYPLGSDVSTGKRLKKNKKVTEKSEGILKRFLNGKFKNPMQRHIMLSSKIAGYLEFSTMKYLGVDKDVIKNIKNNKGIPYLTSSKKDIENLVVKFNVSYPDHKDYKKLKERRNRTRHAILIEENRRFAEQVALQQMMLSF